MSNERATASEGTLRTLSASKGSDSSKKRAQKGKTRAMDSGGANGETNNSESLTCSDRDGGDSGNDIVQSSENGAWCTVTHRKHSLKTDTTTDSRRNDPRTFDDRDRRTGHQDWGDRGRGDHGRGYRGRGDRGRGDHCRGDWGRGDRGRGDRGRGDRGRGDRGRGDRGRSERGRGDRGRGDRRRGEWGRGGGDPRGRGRGGTW